MRNDSIDRLAKRLAESVPENIRAMREDLEQNFRSVLRTSLARLDLVTREEFEVQEAVLARTRQHCDAMEARVKALEASLDASPAAASAKPAKKGKKKAKKKIP
ncbi:MAG TPA: accessory factor UbiK family protein [Woeseiaceae bacterium]|nr:accessory factor UbiK family protein [Woeseiaceae bacterium]